MILVASAVSSSAANLYDATSKRIMPGSGQAYYYNVGIDNGGQAGHILFDDVTVPSSYPIAVFQVTKITVGVSRVANAPSVQITPYYSQMLPDSVRYGGAYDGAFYDPLFVQTFASPALLPVNGGGFVDGAAVTFGDGVSPLFSVVGQPAGPTTAYRSFAIGLKFSTTDNKNGWTIAQQSSNLDVLWDHLTDSSFEEFTYGQDSSGPILGTQYLKVEGSLVPGMPADANFDGRVDARDLGVLAMHWFQPGNFSMGDFNFDGVVDLRDLVILAQNWQAGVPAFSESLESLGLPSTSVPEPAAVAWILPFVMLIPRRAYFSN